MLQSHLGIRPAKSLLELQGIKVGCQQVIDLSACCLWCHEDATPLHYDAGFILQRPPPEYGQLVEALRQYFSFQSLPASA